MSALSRRSPVLKSLAVTWNTFKRCWIRRSWWGCLQHSTVDDCNSPLTNVGRPHTHKHVLSSTPRSSRRSYIDHVHTDTGLSTAGHAAVLVTWWPPQLTGRSPLAADRARQATDHDRRPTYVRLRRPHQSRRCCSAVQIGKVLSRWLRRQHDKAAKTSQ